VALEEPPGGLQARVGVADRSQQAPQVPVAGVLPGVERLADLAAGETQDGAYLLEPLSDVVDRLLRVRLARRETDAGGVKLLGGDPPEPRPRRFVVEKAIGHRPGGYAPSGPETSP
jgi:hypothetical protein